MRAFPALALAVAGAALCTDALAQDRGRTPDAHAPSTTTGAAPSAPVLQTPIGHRQPRAANTPTSEAPVSPYDQQIDRNLDICRGC
jgi:hypothetical protein